MQSETMYLKRFWVSGPGPLPHDMLRYERAYPDRESDGCEARRTGRGVTVQLVMCTSDPDREPARGRWKSFGWFVHESETMALAAGLPRGEVYAAPGGSFGELCPRCDGKRCVACFHTGKALYAIGEHVVLENLDHSLAPKGVQASYEKYMGNVYSVTALMDCPGESFRDVYNVGIDLHDPDGDASNHLVLDVNLRRATADEIAAADAETT